MIFWLDEQLDPNLATWLTKEFAVEAQHVRDLGFAQTADSKLFAAAKQKSDVVLISKDRDMFELLARYGPPPQLIWLTCGNLRTSRLQSILSETFPKALELLIAGERLVEISGKRKPRT